MSVEEPAEIIRGDIRCGSIFPHQFTLKDDNGLVLGAVEYFVKEGLAIVGPLSYSSTKVGQQLLRNLFNEENYKYNCFGIYANTASVQDLFLFCIATRNYDCAGTEKNHLVLAQYVQLPEKTIRYLPAEVEDVHKDLVEIFTNKTTDRSLHVYHGSEVVATLEGSYIDLKKEDTTIFERIIVFAKFFRLSLDPNDSRRLFFKQDKLWRSGEALFVKAVANRLCLVGRSTC